MDEHECYIGLLYKDERNDLVALDDLKEYIEDNKKREEWYCANYGPLHFGRVPGWTLKDYADGRKGHNLTKFNYCPYCGKKIDWKKIKSEEAQP